MLFHRRGFCGLARPFVLQRVTNILHGKDETTDSDNILRGEETAKSTSDELFFIDKGPTASTSTKGETRRTGRRKEEEILPYMGPLQPIKVKD